MKALRLLWVVISVAILTGCQTEKVETMGLLNEKIAEVHVSKSEGFGGVNEKSFLSFTDAKAVNVFKQAITTAIKREGIVDMSAPEYDLIIEYDASKEKLPKHAIHLWLGEEDEGSSLMYLEDDNTVYFTTPEITRSLRDLILMDE